MFAKFVSLPVAAAIGLISAGTAFGADLEVGGNAVNLSIVGQNAVNLAFGAGSSAEQNIGTISISDDAGLFVGGDLVNVGVVGQNAVNLAHGFESTATQNIGTISVAGE